MKLTTLLLILGCLHLNAAVFSQTINLSERNVSLETLFSKMEKQSGYTFFYKTELIRTMPNVNVSVKNVTVKEALDQFLNQFSLTYSIVGKIVVIKPLVSLSIKYNRNPPVIYVGKVLDEHDKPMAGVNVIVKGTNQRVSTNGEGQFVTPIITNVNAILIFSYVGYVTQEFPVSKLKTPIVIKLKVANSDLDQVQVIAYGTTNRREGTGNVTTITAKDIEKNPSRNILEIVQGQVPGLFVQQQSGLPGTPFNLMIRGQQTFAGGIFPSQPLIIIDGVAAPSGGLPIYQPSTTNENVPERLKGGNVLDYIDPSTIESFTVLKDADATSIYGSRGAYGVILITTKRGKSGDPQLRLNATMGLTARGPSPELLNTEQYITLRKEALANDGTAIGAGDNDVNGNWPADRYTNWAKEFTNNYAAVNRVNASYSGGTSELRFLIGGNYRKQNSIQIGKGSARDGGINFNIDNNTKNNKFKISLSGTYLSTTDDAVPYDFSQSNSITAPPNSPPLFLPDGSLNWETNSNPAAAMNIIFKNVTNNLNSNLGLRYEPIKGLTFNVNVGYNFINSKELRAQPSTYYKPGTDFKTTSTLNVYSVRNITVEPNMGYVTALGKKGTFTVQTGGTLQNQLTYYTRTTGNDFISDAMLYNPSFADALTTAAVPAANISTAYDQTPNKYIGFFGIINYNWDSKYIINLNGRYDGSTKFGENKQFGSFGSVGAAWIISKEKFFSSLLPVVSFAKLRGSYGTSGGDGIGNYGFITTYSKTTQYQGSLSLVADNLSNKELHWEFNKKGEVGLNLAFLDEKISLDASYYNTITKDQLVNQLLPIITGFQGRILNSPAVIRNWGYEFELTTQNMRKRNFSWRTRFNFTLPHNKLVAYPGLETTVTSTNYAIGRSMQGIKVYKFAGVDPKTGLYNFINAAGVKGTYRTVLDPATLDQIKDKTEFIDLTPKFYGGLSNTFTYKGLSLDVFFTFTNRMGKTFVGSQSFPAGFAGTNVSTVMLDRWQKDGDVTDIQKAGGGLSSFFSQGNFVSSDGAYERATYARLQSLNLSYALPANLLKSFHIGGLSVFAQGSNLLTISKYKDLDPENLGAGMAPLRFFTGGFNLTL